MKILVTFIFLLSSLSINAQIVKVGTNISLNEKREEPYKLVNNETTLNKMRISIKTPLKYTRYNRDLPLFCYSSSMQYGFINKDSSILIGIALMATDSAFYKRDKEVTKLLRPDLPDYNPNDQWWIGFKGTADSTFFKPIFYSGKKLAQYNAENGVEFYKACSDIYLDRYKVARVIRLNKKYKGIIEIHYFLKLGAKNDINKVIRNGAKMISYNK